MRYSVFRLYYTNWTAPSGVLLGIDYSLIFQQELIAPSAEKALATAIDLNLGFPRYLIVVKPYEKHDERGIHPSFPVGDSGATDQRAARRADGRGHAPVHRKYSGKVPVTPIEFVSEG